MENTWAARRKVIYGIIFFIGGFILIGVPAYLVFHRPANCFDGKENGKEEGIDCGGACQMLCQNDQAYPIVLWTRMFMVSPGVYSAVAYIENPNVGAYAAQAPYTFKLRDEKGVIIAERSGEVYVPAHKVFAAFEGNIAAGDKIPAHIEFEFGKPPFWQRAKAEEPRISVVSKFLSKEDSLPRIDATIHNDSIYDVGRIQVMAIVYEGNGNAVGASRTYIDELAKGQGKDIVFTWPNHFTTELATCEAPADVTLLIDRSGSMMSDGRNPPEPLTAVKNAASSFVDNLSTRDQASIISFATMPSRTPDHSLTANFADLKAAIQRIAIIENGTQYTNIGDALKAAQDEFGAHGRGDAKKEVVLLTDGMPTNPEKTDDKEYPRTYAIEAANALKTSGIDIYTIGLGKSVDGSFLESIASASDHYFAAPASDTLKNIYKEIATAICRKSPTVIELIPLIEH